MPMPARIIWRVNIIGEREGQGRAFRFLNRNREAYSWMNDVPEDDPDFQGLLEEEVPFPDVSAEPPGVILEAEEPVGQTNAVEDKPKPDFTEQADAALENENIRPEDHM